MRPIIWLLSLLLLLIIQAGVLVPLNLTPVNLILVMVTVAVLLADLNLGLGLAITGGVLLDLAAGTPDGLMALSLLCVFLFLYWIVNSALAREPSQVILFTSVAAGTIAYFIIFLLLNRVFGVFGLSAGLSTRYVLTVELPWSLMFNLLFTYPVFQYYLKVQKWTARSRSTI